jgi:PAS domain S-box-containing protein
LDQVTFARRALLDAGGCALIGVDREGRTVFWNAAAQALFGWTSDEVLGRPLPIVPLPLLQEWRLQMQRVFETGEPTPVAETQRIAREGQPIWVVRSSAPVRDTDGQIIGLLDTLLDSGPLKQLDEESRALAQLREREQIAMDLHDGLIQSLYAVVLNLAAQEHAVAPSQVDTLAALKTARSMVEGVIQETRNYVQELRGRQLAPRNLGSGLRLLADSMRLNAGVDVHLTCDPAVEGLLQPDVRGHLLYLVREAASNVVRHAQASRVRIQLARSDDCLRVSIADNGRGFSPSARAEASPRHHGLRNMAERARLIGGRLDVKSHKGRGTCICVEMKL